MIKMMGHHNGRPFLGLVLTRENIMKLQNDEPIHFHAEEMGILSINVKEVVIIFFETENDAKEYFKKQGLLENTIITEYNPNKN